MPDDIGLHFYGTLKDKLKEGNFTNSQKCLPEKQQTIASNGTLQDI